MRLKTLLACAWAMSVMQGGAAYAERAHAKVEVTATVLPRCDVTSGAELEGFVQLDCQHAAAREVRVVTNDARVMVDIQF